MSRRVHHPRAAKNGASTVPADEPSAIRVAKTTLEAVSLTKYRSPVNADGSFSTASSHMCLHNNSGAKMTIEIVDKRRVKRIHCLAEDVHPSMTVFAAEEGEFKDICGDIVHFKVCRICACMHFIDIKTINDEYPRVTDEGKRRVTSSDLLSHLKTEWKTVTTDDRTGMEITMIGSLRMMEYWIKTTQLQITHADLQDEFDAIGSEINEIRRSGLLEGSIGKGGDGFSTGKFASKEVLAFIHEQPVMGGWLKRVELALAQHNFGIRGAYFATRGSETTYMPWHADGDYTKCLCRKIVTFSPNGKKIMCLINRHTGEWFAFEVVHGMDVTMSREVGGPDNSGMMHAIPPGGGGHLLAMEIEEKETGDH